MYGLVRKLAAFSVEKYYMALTEIHLKVCRFHGCLSQKGSRPLPKTIFFSLQTRSLAKHSKGLNSSLVQSSEELHRR